MSDPAPTTAESLPTRRPLPVPEPLGGPERLRPLVEATPPGSGPTGSPTPAPATGAPAAPATAGGSEAGAAAGGGEWTCPHCSAVLDASAHFCEVCGYDPSTNSLPQARAPQARPAEPPPAAAAPAAGPLVAVITADADHYASTGWTRSCSRWRCRPARSTWATTR